MNPIESLAGYIAEINAIYEDLEKMNVGETPYALFFRGHSKTSYELLPTALRKGVNGAEKNHLLNYRDNMPRHSHSYDFIKQRTEILVDMQHFGMQTRLLDWTFSPLIALYFALNHDNGNENSEVCVFNPWVYRKIFFAASLNRVGSRWRSGAVDGRLGDGSERPVCDGFGIEHALEGCAQRI